MLNAQNTGMMIAQYVQSAAPQPGEPVTEAQLTTLWQGIVNIIYTDLKTNGVVIPTALVSPTGPVTGTGNIS